MSRDDGADASWDDFVAGSEDEMQFRGFTDEERSTIECALASAGLAAGPDLSLRLAMLTMKEFTLTSAPYRRLEAECKEIYDALVLVDKLLQPRIEEHGEMEGKILWDPFGRLYNKIRPTIIELARLSVRKGEEYLSDAERFKKYDPSPAEKPMQIRLGREIARIWTRRGGSISGKKEYREFFTAVAKPIYESEFGKSQRLCWTENTFPDHVRAWKEGRYEVRLTDDGN